MEKLYEGKNPDPSHKNRKVYKMLTRLPVGNDLQLSAEGLVVICQPL